MRRIIAAAFSAALAAVAATCGQKGPLTLPEQPPAAVAAPVSDHAIRP